MPKLAKSKRGGGSCKKGTPGVKMKCTVGGPNPCCPSASATSFKGLPITKSTVSSNSQLCRINPSSAITVTEPVIKFCPMPEPPKQDNKSPDNQHESLDHQNEVSKPSEKTQINEVASTQARGDIPQQKASHIEKSSEDLAMSPQILKTLASSIDLEKLWIGKCETLYLESIVYEEPVKPERNINRIEKEAESLSKYGWSDEVSSGVWVDSLSFSIAETNFFSGTT